jgi:hypothetical protein
VPLRWRALCASGALLWTLGAGHAQAAAFEELDRIVAVVGARSPGPSVHLVLASDVALRARLALLSEADPDALTRPLPESLRAAVLSQILGELMLAAEAERLSMAAPTATELSAERARLTASVGGEAVLMQALGVLQIPAEELGAVVILRATVAGFLDANLERITVTEADVDAALAAIPAGESVSRGVMRVRLRQQRVEDAVASWVGTLAQRVPHRVLE